MMPKLGDVAGGTARIFQLYAYENQTLESVVRRLHEEGAIYRPSAPAFNRTSVHNVLNDRAYVGEIRYRDAWYPGKQQPIIDRPTWDRVQALLNSGNNQSHSLTYVGGLIKCGHCDHQITGELKSKKTKSGERFYSYYYCTHYRTAGHPRVRVTEAELDRQMLDIFDKMRIDDEAVREWFRTILVLQTEDAQSDSTVQRTELQRQTSLLIAQQDRLLNIHLAGDIDQPTFAQKQTELRDRLASIKLQLDVLDRSHDEMTDLAVKAFELSQTLSPIDITSNVGMTVEANGILPLRRPGGWTAPLQAELSWSPVGYAYIPRSCRGWRRPAVVQPASGPSTHCGSANRRSRPEGLSQTNAEASWAP